LAITNNPYYRYDFNGDGLISKEDVRIVLSYIPFKRNIESAEDKLSAMSVGGAEKK
jgi:Ca2+-binding EF-hand superfamily protein